MRHHTGRAGLREVPSVDKAEEIFSRYPTGTWSTPELKNTSYDPRTERTVTMPGSFDALAVAYGILRPEIDCKAAAMRSQLDSLDHQLNSLVGKTALIGLEDPNKNEKTDFTLFSPAINPLSYLVRTTTESLGGGYDGWDTSIRIKALAATYKPECDEPLVKKTFLLLPFIRSVRKNNKLEPKVVNQPSDIVIVSDPDQILEFGKSTYGDSYAGLMAQFNRQLRSPSPARV